MDISNEHLLTKDNYISIETPKSQIVLGHTFNNNMKHIIGWLHRYNGFYKKTAAFTIGIDGVIYKHFDPKFYSRYFNKEIQDKKSIIILLENDGWLIKDNEKNEFITWVGDIYNKENGVNAKKWRGYEYWSSYNEKQMESVSLLINMLCEEFDIPKVAMNHNTKVDDLNDFKGILYKSNLDKHCTDLSPAWDCIELINKLVIN